MFDGLKFQKYVLINPQTPILATIDTQFDTQF